MRLFWAEIEREGRNWFVMFNTRQRAAEFLFNIKLFCLFLLFVEICAHWYAFQTEWNCKKKHTEICVREKDRMSYDYVILFFV